MSKSPWSVTRTKREAKSRSATPAQKRQRHSEKGDKSAAARRKSQQTLTQAQWVTSFGSNYDEGDMQLLDYERPQNILSKRPRQTVRNSTLTQMDFFHIAPQDSEDFDDTMIQQSPGHTATSGGGGGLPQYDGAYESPRKPRKPKAGPHPSETRSSRKQKSASESQKQYEPAKSRKRKASEGDEGMPDSERRRSHRLAIKNEVLSDPVENFDYFADALGTPDETFGYSLEIQDSTEEKLPSSITTQPTSVPSIPPQTPKRNMTIVLSSQSPESLRASTRKTNRKLFETPSRSQRTPLAERSTNVPTHAAPKSPKRRQSYDLQSPKRKIIVLKLPKRNRAQRPTRIENSQTSVWSLPSSSPQITRKVPPTKVPPESVVQDDLEIPATSEPHGTQLSTVGSQESLRSLSELFSTRRLEAAADPESSLPTQDDNVAVRDVAANPERNPAQAFQVSSPPAVVADINVPNPEETADLDEDLDFGSPIANDTQFNIQLQHRMSSPRPSAQSIEGEGTANSYLARSTPMPGVACADGGDEAAPGFPDIDRVQSSQSPIPTPRLVERSSVAPGREDNEANEEESNEVSLPQPIFARPTSTRQNSTQVPLNDTYQNSSSPALRATQIATQKSVRPASMPHPSQISTQDPTQAFLPPSSMPQSGPSGPTQGEHKITIKDSSSVVVPLSQIPRHIANSQMDFDPIAALDDDDEDDEDLDLDPPSSSLLPPRCSRAQASAARQPGQDDPTTTSKAAPFTHSQTADIDIEEEPLSPNHASSSTSPLRTPDRAALQREQYTPIPGFDNETQSNFTQNGHVTAAFIHRQREEGLYPKWFVPTPYQVPGYTRRK